MQLANRAQLQPLPNAWVKKLIQKMQILYGAKFAQQWEGIDPGIMEQEWAEELADYSGPELAAGLAACKTRTFPPTLPEFMVLCRPPINAENAFHEAVRGLISRRKGDRGTWSHPAIYHATIEAGQHDMLNCTYSTMKNRWDKALTDQLAKSEWAEIPDAPIALPEPKKTELTNAEAKAAMDRMGAGGILNKSGRDHKAWAHKILADQKGRSPTVIAMARRAVEEQAA